MPFWSKQPVFHIYNILYWLNPPGLISPHIPLISKHVDLLNIKIHQVSDEDERKTLFTSICNFIKDNYVKDKKYTNYSPTKNEIIEYLQGSNHASYFTVYQQPKLLFNKNVPETSIDEIIGVISARPLYVRIQQKNLFTPKQLLSTKKLMFPTYYVDNLCVQPAYRKKNIASSMIATHYYSLRKENKYIQTCLFKREGELNSIVPLVTFNTYCIETRYFTNNLILLEPSISLIEIGLQQMHLFVDFIKIQIGTFQCSILPDITNLTGLIKKGHIKAYCLVDKSISGGSIISCYIFKISNTSYDGQKTVECIATIASCQNTIFINGFSLALQKIENLNTEQVTLVLIEDTSHTNRILHNLYTNKNSIKFISPTAFFFYNYACYSFKKNEVLIIY
jgi:ribosomal protein S18 acetylase RimI-like enzyme